MRWMLFVSLLWCASAVADEVTVFTTRHLPPQQLVPLIKPVLGEHGSVSAFGDKLIVRAAADKLEEVRWLISELDKPQRNLLIEVQVGKLASGHDLGLDAQGSWREGGPEGHIRYRRHSTRAQGDSLQSVRTLEGRAALISIGQSVPVYEAHQTQHPDGTTSQGFRQRFREANRGFYALPRIHGERVTIEIHQQDDSPSQRTGHFNTQHASTIVSGALGEWISLGGVDQRQARDGSGLGYSAKTARSDERHLSLRVTVLP